MRDLIQIVELLVQQLERQPGAEGHHHLGHRGSQEVDSRQDPRSTAATVRVHCAAPCSATSKIPCRRRSLPDRSPQRPAFLEVYLDANQLFYRPVSADETATEEKPAGILLFSA